MFIDDHELHSHSFVIRIRREDNHYSALRGHIKHVPTGKECFFKDFNGLIDFIVPYVVDMNIPLSLNWRLKFWVQQQIAALKNNFGE